MLWRIQNHSSVDQLTEEVVTAFPDLLLAFPTKDYFLPERNLGMLIETRFIERFLQFWGFWDCSFGIAVLKPRSLINPRLPRLRKRQFGNVNFVELGKL